MRSRIDTITRLAAHVTAVVLLVLVWVSTEPKQPPIQPRIIDLPSEPVTLPAVPAEPIAVSPAPAETSPPPVEPPAAESAVPVSDEPVPEPPADAPIAPASDEATAAAEPTEGEPSVPADTDEIAQDEVQGDGHRLVFQSPEGMDEAEAARRRLVTGPGPAMLPDRVEAEPAPGEESDKTESAPPSDGEETAAEAQDPAPAAEPVAAEPEDGQAAISAREEEPAAADQVQAGDDVSPTPETTPVPPGEAAPPETGEEEKTDAEAEQPLPMQPDESGALVVADGEASRPEEAALPLPEAAGLEVLGDGVYWIGPDGLADKIPHLPENTRVVALAPTTDSPSLNLGIALYDVIPAVGENLDADAAERFLRDLQVKPGESAVAVALPGAWGAAFFKGAFLLAVRDADPDAAFAELEPELGLAGERRDEILHRLRRLDVDSLRALVKP